MTGFGIIGCGMIARFHARAIREVRGARLVACTSSRWASAEGFAREFECRAYPTLAEMLQDPRLDVVTICTPSGAHMEPCLAAARAGKHVIVEKPLEVTLKRCDRMIRACEDHGVVLATIFPSRFHAAAQQLKCAMEQERFGRLTLGDAEVKWFRTQAYYDQGEWRGTWLLDGGGALMNQAIHTVDLLLWLMGPVASVTAHTALLAHERIEVEDTAVATLRFENGALGVIQASTAVHPGFLKRVAIHGSGGSAILEEESLVAWAFAKKRKSDDTILAEGKKGTTRGGGAADPSDIGHQAHRALFENVLRGLRRPNELVIDGREGRRSVELILAIYAAAASGREIRLPLRRDPQRPPKHPVPDVI